MDTVVLMLRLPVYVAGRLNYMTGRFMYKKISGILLTVMLLAACGTENIKIDDKKSDPVTTAKWKGKAKIVSIAKKAGRSSGADYFEVRFDFIPDDPSAAGSYLVKEAGDKNIVLFYDDSTEFHKSWLDKWGLKTGNIYRAVRHENTLNSEGNRAAFEVILEPR